MIVEGVRERSSTHRRPALEITLTLLISGCSTTMAASFFNNKARAAAAAASSSSKSKAGDNKEDSTRLQPWVEK